ncbi:MAG: hypothetical protein HYW48_04990 [Deltaproteobacteria bacterium]|nr:hypothetical protein [Deltaproteobacteria bacterium]
MRIVLALFFLTSSLAFAHGDTKMGMFVGSGVDASYSDHALAGRVGQVVFYASPLKEEFGTKLTFRAHGLDQEAFFRKSGEDFVGTLILKNESGVLRPVVFKIDRIDRDEHKVFGSLNDIPFELHVRAKEMNGNHYINPEFEVVTNGKSLSYRLENGKVCMSCVANTSFVILSLLNLQGKI